LMFASLASLSAYAADYDFTVDGLYYKIVSVSDFTCRIVAGEEKYTGDIVIPASVTYKGKSLSVVEISDSTFCDCTRLTLVNIPNSVTYIDSYAFSGCTKLTAIDIPNSVVYISSYSFRGCTGFTSVDIPNGIESIGEGAFEGCAGLIAISIPQSIEIIGERAFYGCTELDRVYISDLATWCKIDFRNKDMFETNEVSSNPLYYAKHLYVNGEEITDMIIPDEVTLIGYYAFFGWKGLTSVSIPNSVTDIGFCAFKKCSGLVSVSLPNSITMIFENVFEDCTSLTSVCFPNSVTTIYDLAFAGCTSLSSVSFPYSVTDISSSAFSDCTSLVQMEIRNSYTMDWILYRFNKISTLIIANDYIDAYIPMAYSYRYGSQWVSYPISKNTSLKTIVSKTDFPVALGSSGISDSQYMDLEVIVPTLSLADYQTADVWKDFWCLKGGAEEYTTSINSVTADGRNKPATIYNLQGRRLNAPRHGINIIGGKKVFIK